MKIRAHVPTQQYGFVEIEGGPEDKAEIERLYNEYAESPIAFRKGSVVRKKDFFGNEIDWDAENHIYSWNGEKYLSGSEFAKQGQKPFDPAMISQKVVNGTDVKAEDLAKVWEMSGHVSREFGTVVHEALEVYGKFLELSKALGKEYHTPNHPVLKDIVESFYKGREGETAYHEVLVVDHKTKRAGTIDRLVIIGPRSCIIEDFKITHKEELKYWEDQLGFYEGIIKANGWKVEGKRIHQYSDSWRKFSV